MSGVKEQIPPVSKTERPSILNRIVSERLSAEEKEQITEELCDKLESQDIEEIKEGEVELSPRQVELAAEANRLIASALKSAGIRPKIEITSSMIHLVRPDVFERYLVRKNIKGDSIVALTSFEDETVLIKYQEYGELQFLDRVIHEALHMNSFVSLQAVDLTDETESGTGVVKRRAGLRMKETTVEGSKKAGDKKVMAGRTFFNDLDEAVIGKLTVDIIRNFNIQLSPEVKSDFEKSEKLRKLLIERITKVFNEKSSELSEKEVLELVGLYAVLNWQAMLLPEAGNFLEMYEPRQDTLVLEQAISFYTEQEANGSIPYFVYNPQRLMLDKLMSDILKKNEGKFSNSREVALLFIKASFEGRVLPLARVIESTFGEGSFRRLGEGEDITDDFSEEKS